MLLLICCNIPTSIVLLHPTLWSFLGYFALKLNLLLYCTCTFIIFFWESLQTTWLLHPALLLDTLEYLATIWFTPLCSLECDKDFKFHKKRHDILQLCLCYFAFLRVGDDGATCQLLTSKEDSYQVERGAVGTPPIARKLWSMPSNFQGWWCSWIKLFLLQSTLANQPTTKMNSLHVAAVCNCAHWA